MSSLQDKVIAITGAASGIGLALTKLVAARGAKLALADMQREALDDLVAQLKSSGVEAVGTCVNVTRSQEVDDWITATKAHFGRLDGAANLAGVSGKTGVSANIWEQRNDEWDFILAVNLTGLMYCVRAQVGVMEKGASIVNAASVAGLIGRPGIGAYAASKHGVVGLTKTVAKEVGPAKGIRVNAVAP
jgi:NAD(P)-dependent dehydrogenase (short-subunit alcohol dehydrogenase family)